MRCEALLRGASPTGTSQMGCRLGILPCGYIADEPVHKESPARDVPDGEYPQSAPHATSCKEYSQ